MYLILLYITSYWIQKYKYDNIKTTFINLFFILNCKINYKINIFLRFKIRVLHYLNSILG